MRLASPTSLRRIPPLFAGLLPCLPQLAAQHGKPDARPAMVVAPASDEAAQQIARFQLAPGLVCDLVAAEPDLCNPVAFCIDGQGRFYIAETFRINDGVFDTRSYMQWKDDDLACRTVADRLAKYQRHIAKDIPKYDAYSERIRLLVDTDRNGTLDRATVYATDFAALADGIASGVLAVGNDVYFTNIPKLWRLRDQDGDGIADERSVLHDGYGVHTSLIGHDLHGLIVGPDRRLYFSIGDRGFHVEHEGQVHAYPDEGAVLRCELDGSQLEVMHRGLRNPQELAFDDFGDLFTGDNNSDGGDRARFVQIVPGADSGWRIGYQWLSDRGAWNRELLWQPRHPGQPAWILPPIANVGDGPSGLAFDPGQGLPERFRGCFFLCDFRGGSSFSGIRALRLQRHGAGHELLSDEKPIWGALATDVDFGPDGALYFSDWVTGWNKTGKGRIYRVRTATMANDPALRSTAALLASDLRSRGATGLRPLLAHRDRRVRQAAQFALVDLGAIEVLADIATHEDHRLARIHALFGLGILGRSDANALTTVPKLLQDGCADVRATAARVLGEARLQSAGRNLLQALGDANARVRREAALALARFGSRGPDSTKALVELLRQNDDRDAVLRHAAVHALASRGDRDAVQAFQRDDSRAVRLGVLLTQARLADDRIASFLNDADAELRAAAAEAIYRIPIPGAMQALANLANLDEPPATPILWRALNSNRLLGSIEHGEAVLHIARSARHPEASRREAIEILAEWPNPHGQDRVLGNWRPCTHANAQPLLAALSGALPELLADAKVAAAAARAAGQLRLASAAPALLQLLRDPNQPAAARLQALDALDQLQAAELDAALAEIGTGAPVPLRKRAIELLSRQQPERAVPVLASLLEDAPRGEQQAAFTALGDLRHSAAANLLERWLQRLRAGELPTALQLELLEAAAKHPELQTALTAAEAHLAGNGAIGRYEPCLDGGDAKAGRKLFLEFAPASCTRCHSLDNKGGNAGPALDGIGKRHSGDYLLRALITPESEIAAGFGAVTLDLTGERSYTGVITRDQDGVVHLVVASGETLELAQKEILRRRPSAGSAMPAMGGVLDRRQLRDVMAFLQSLR